MTNHEKEVLKELDKDHLIYLIEQMNHSLNMISLACVDESKWHIDSKEAVRRIRERIYHKPSFYESIELKAYIDMKMEKISVEEYRKIIGLED